MIIPNTREKGEYSEGHLNERNQEFIRGYDYLVENVIDTFFSNLEIYKDEMDIEGEDINLIKILENHEAIRDRFKGCLEHYIEMERNECVVNMIEEQEYGEDR